MALPVNGADAINTVARSAVHNFDIDLDVIVISPNEVFLRSHAGRFDEQLRNAPHHPDHHEETQRADGR